MPYAHDINLHHLLDSSKISRVLSASATDPSGAGVPGPPGFIKPMQYMRHKSQMKRPQLVELSNLFQSRCWWPMVLCTFPQEYLLPIEAADKTT